MQELGTYRPFGLPLPFLVERGSSLILGEGRTLLYNLCISDILEGENVLFIGETSEPILERVPKRHQKRTIHISPLQNPFPSNFIAKVPPEKHSLYASVLTQAIIGQSNFSIDPVVLKKYLRRTLQTLLAVADTSLLSVYYLLTSKTYRDKVLVHIDDPILKDIWDNFEAMSPKQKLDETQTTVTRAEAIVLDPVLRASLDQKDNKLQFKNKVVLVSLNDYQMGQDNAALYGMLVLAYAYISSLEGIPLRIYVDGAERFGKDILEKLQDVATVTATSKRILHTFPRMYAFRTMEDEDKLTKHLHILPSEVPVSELPDNVFYVREGYRAIQVEEHPLRFPVTKEARKIRERSASLSQPKEKLDQRLGRFF